MRGIKYCIRGAREVHCVCGVRGRYEETAVVNVEDPYYISFLRVAPKDKFFHDVAFFLMLYAVRRWCGAFGFAPLNRGGWLPLYPADAVRGQGSVFLGVVFCRLCAPPRVVLLTRCASCVAPFGGCALPWAAGVCPCRPCGLCSCQGSRGCGARWSIAVLINLLFSLVTKVIIPYGQSSLKARLC